MFDNLLLLTILIIVLWVGAFGYYLYTSRQQRKILEQVEKLQKKMDQAEEKSGR